MITKNKYKQSKKINTQHKNHIKKKETLNIFQCRFFIRFTVAFFIILSFFPFSMLNGLKKTKGKILFSLQRNRETKAKENK